MVVRIEGWFQCENCGHNATPLDPDFQCACARCAASPPPTRPDPVLGIGRGFRFEGVRKSAFAGFVATRASSLVCRASSRMMARF